MKDKFQYKYMAFKTEYLYEIMSLHKRERMVLAWFLRHIEPCVKRNGIPFVITLRIEQKKGMLKELGWKNVSSIDNALSALVKADILWRIDYCEYQLNPGIFASVEVLDEWCTIK